MMFNGSMPTKWVSHTPSDSTDITGSIGFYVGGSGNVVAQCLNNTGVSVTFAALQGTVIPGNFTRIMASSTATNILVAY